MKKYLKKVSKQNVLPNMSNLFPQTYIHDIIDGHFKSAGDKKKKALIIVLDGCRSDCMPYIMNQSYGIRRIIDAGGIYGVYGSNDTGTFSCATAPCFASMLTGIWADEGTGVLSNESFKDINPPSVISKIALDGSGRTVSVLATWSGHTDIQYYKEFLHISSINNTFDVVNTADDNVLTDIARERVKSYDATFCFFDSTDGAGHKYGYGDNVVEYVADLLNANVKIDKILDEVVSRKEYKDEDWLIVATTDHGGQGTSHWQHTAYERLVWLACNKKLDYSNVDNSRLKF